MIVWRRERRKGIRKEVKSIRRKNRVEKEKTSVWRREGKEVRSMRRCRVEK